MSNKKIYIGTDIGNKYDMSVLIAITKQGEDLIIITSKTIDLRALPETERQKRFRKEIEDLKLILSKKGYREFKEITPKQQPYGDKLYRI